MESVVRRYGITAQPCIPLAVPFIGHFRVTACFEVNFFVPSAAFGVFSALSLEFLEVGFGRLVVLYNSLIAIRLEALCCKLCNLHKNSA